MSTDYGLNLSKEQVKEMPMVDLAFRVLKAVNKTMYYRDLMTEVAKVKGISKGETTEVIAQLYTEINIDGRFACVGGNYWGLKRWYPVDKSGDENLNTQRPRIINDEDDDDDDDDAVYDEEDDNKGKKKKKKTNDDNDNDDEDDDDNEDNDDEDDEEFYDDEDDDEDDEDFDEEFDEEDEDEDESDDSDDEDNDEKK